MAEYNGKKKELPVKYQASDVEVEEVIEEIEGKETLQVEMDQPHQDMMKVRPFQRKRGRGANRWKARRQEALIQENEDLLLENENLLLENEDLRYALEEKTSWLEACEADNRALHHTLEDWRAKFRKEKYSNSYGLSNKLKACEREKEALQRKLNSAHDLAMMHKTCEAEKRTLQLEKEQLCQDMEQLRLKACGMEEALSHKNEELDMLQKQMALSTQEHNNKLQAEVEDKESLCKEMEQLRLKACGMEEALSHKNEELDTLQKQMALSTQEYNNKLQAEVEDKESLCKEMEQLRLKACGMEEALSHKNEELDTLQKQMALSTQEYNNKLQAEVEDKESVCKEMEQLKLKTEELNVLQKELTVRVQELELQLKLERQEKGDLQQKKEDLDQKMRDLDSELGKERALNEQQQAMLLQARETEKGLHQDLQDLKTTQEQSNMDMQELRGQLSTEMEQRDSLSQEVAALRQQLDHQTLKMKSETLPPQNECSSRESEEGSGSKEKSGEDLKKKSKKSSFFRRIVKALTPKQGKKKTKGAEKGEKVVQQ